METSAALPPAPALSGVTDAVTELLASAPILETGYFTRLASGAMSREAFLISQKEFYHAVRYFSRPMAALVSRLPDSGTRMTLVHNLAEEHGDFVPEMAHDRTFLAFLKSLDEAPGDLAKSRPGVSVSVFNVGLMGVCLAGERAEALACLGFIEYAFADISAFIGNAVVDRGWVSPENLRHYALHAELDRRHAAEFFDGVASDWASGGERRAAVVSGLRLGHRLFTHLYADLAAEVAR